MIKEKEKLIDVKVNKNGKEEIVKIVVKKPNNSLVSKSTMIGAKVWSECLRDQIMTKKELENFMKEHDIWNKDKEDQQKKLTEEINALERDLYIGSKKKITKSEGKNIAIKMRIKRAELRDLIGERMSLEQNTAESLCDNAKFDFLVANSTYYENGQKVYNNLEDYSENSDSEIAFAAATALAQLMYSIDKDFEARLPENKFLKMFNFVNEDLSLVNENGHTVDTQGRRIDSNGYYIDSDGNRVDRDGNRLDENGNYIMSVEYVDDDIVEEPESSEAPKKTKKKVTES